MTSWDIAMLALVPFIRGHQRLRTWVALMGASLATFVVADPLGYMAIDAVAAALVMTRPSGLPQKAIGALFTLMVVFDLGFYLSPQNNWEFFVNCLIFVGWVQWAILGAWIGHDAFRRYRGWSGSDSGIPAAYKGRAG